MLLKAHLSISKNTFSAKFSFQNVKCKHLPIPQKTSYIAPNILENIYPNFWKLPFSSANTESIQAFVAVGYRMMF